MMARTVEACSTRFPYTVNLNRPQFGVVKRNRSNLGEKDHHSLILMEISIAKENRPAHELLQEDCKLNEGGKEEEEDKVVGEVLH